MEANRAKVLLDQMAGWLGGIIEEALLERRIRAEAEAKAREQRGVGFSG